MKNIQSEIILNIKIEDIELISEINIISQELNISFDELLLLAIKKMLYDINLVRDLRH